MKTLLLLVVVAVAASFTYTQGYKAGQKAELNVVSSLANHTNPGVPVPFKRAVQHAFGQ
jgi:hypothetical protein